MIYTFQNTINTTNTKVTKVTKVSTNPKVNIPLYHTFKITTKLTNPKQLYDVSQFLILPFWAVSLEYSKEIQQKRGDKVTLVSWVS